MPKTKTEKTVFGILMAFVMVYGMEVYNASLRHCGLTAGSLTIPAAELLLLTAAVFFIQTFIGGPLARKLAFSVVDPAKHRRRIVITTVSAFTVLCMCPIMSLVAVLVFQMTGGRIAHKWLMTFLFNFPIAFFWQLAVAGPLVRFLFRRTFRAKRLDSEGA